MIQQILEAICALKYIPRDPTQLTLATQPEIRAMVVASNKKSTQNLNLPGKVITAE